MTPRRRLVFAGLLFALSATVAFGQSASKLPMVAYVYGSLPTSALTGPDPANPNTRAFVDRLRELGWEDGRNVVLERHGAGGSREQAQAIFADVVGRRVDLIYSAATAAGTVIAIYAVKATRTIPIVFAGSSDPIGMGLVASLARPGGNVTGVATGISFEIVGKRLELLKALAPGIKRVAYLDPKGAPSYGFAQQAATRLGMTLTFVEVERSEQYDNAFAIAARERSGAVMVGADSVHQVHGSRIAALASQRRLPVAGYFSGLPEAGGLMSYGIDFLDLARNGAGYVDKILRGAKSADLPVEQPRKFEFVVNAKTARALGLTIPQSVLLQADRVIE